MGSGKRLDDTRYAHLWDFAECFGWDPARVDELDHDEYLYFIAGFEHRKKQAREAKP